MVGTQTENQSLCGQNAQGREGVEYGFCESGAACQTQLLWCFSESLEVTTESRGRSERGERVSLLSATESPAPCHRGPLGSGLPSFHSRGIPVSSCLDPGSPPLLLDPGSNFAVLTSRLAQPGLYLSSI